MAANVYDTILLVGDSITEGGWIPGGFAQRLTEVYGRRMDVINRGLGGYNSEWGLTVFKQIFAQKFEQRSLPTVRLLTIWWGANDSVIEGTTTQYVDISKFAENLHTTISLIKSPTSLYHSPKTHIVLLTPPPVNRAQLNPILKKERNNDRTKAYAEAVKTVGEETGVHVLDVWTAFWERGGEKEEGLEPLLSDGLHLTGEGYKIAFDLLMAHVKEAKPELAPDNYPRIFPSWDAVDPDDIPPRKRD